MKVYLAGPIANCTDWEAAAWRDKINDPNIEVLNPMDRDMRHVDRMTVEQVKYVVEGDKAAIDQADFVLANCWKPGWGTAMEIIYAFSKGIPVVAVFPPNTKISPWVRYHSERVFRNMDDALDYIVSGVLL